jgi:phosphoribosylanthranilate isomerase
MPKPFIKICGLQNSELAYKTAQLGADFVGLVFHPGSKRFVELALAQEIAAAVKAGGAKPVAVFTQQNFVQMQNICLSCEIEVIQLHDVISKTEHHLFEKNYQRLFVQNVSIEGRIVADNTGGINYCQKSRDFLLFDNLQPGLGRRFAWHNFHYTGELNFGLAGGLNHINVVQALQQLKPNLVDVSSGVEDSAGNKDLNLIQSFINAVNLCKIS